MTISSTIRKAGPFSGTGAQTAYPFAFKVFGAGDMLVVLTDANGIETVQALTANYTVSLNADQNVSPGGTVTMSVPPPAGYLLTVGSVVQPTQGQSIQNNGGFYPKIIENALDKLTISVQQIAESAARSFKLAFSDTGSPNLPAAAARANKLLSFDANGNPVAVAANPGSATALQLSLASAVGAAMVSYNNAGTTRTVEQMLDLLYYGVVNLRDKKFAGGAKGDGVTDDTAAIQAAIDFYTKRYDAYPKHDVYARGSLKTLNRRVSLYFPQGVYLITATLDARWRGFIDFIGDNSTIIAGANVNGAMLDLRYSSNVRVERLTFEAAKDFGNRFLHCVSAGGSADKVADGYNSATLVHFIESHFRNPADTCLNLMSNSSNLALDTAGLAGTFKASVDGCKIDGCFFAGGAVGFKYCGYEAWVSNCYFASQTYAGSMLYDNATLTYDKCLFSLNNAVPSTLIDTDNNIDSARYLSCYWEQGTYIVQALGAASDKRANLYFDGGRFESQQSGLIAMGNRHCTVTIKNVHIGNTNNNTSIACGNAFSTLVLEQNQIDQDYLGAVGNVASWVGPVFRTGFIAGNPVFNSKAVTTDIYVDHISGNDSNEGYANARAVATVAEALRRVNALGNTNIRLSSGTDAAPANHPIPANCQQYMGRVYFASWEKYSGQTNPIDQRTKIDGSANKYQVWGGTLKLQNVTLVGTRAITMYAGKLDLQSVRVAVSDVTGHIFVQSGTVSTRTCNFTGSGGVAFYIGDQDGIQATLFGDSNNWGAGIIKYQAYSNITTLVLSNL